MYAHPNRKLLDDMDKTQLLHMRESGMNNKEIANAVGCCPITIGRILGPMTKEERARVNRENIKKSLEVRSRRASEGGYTVERKAPSMMPQREAEPVKAVLAVKKTDTHLTGTYKNYVVAADRSYIDVETEDGRTLLNIPADMLGTFIKELTAIQKNMNTAQSMPFWG